MGTPSLAGPMLTGVCSWCEVLLPPAQRAGADGTIVSHSICLMHAAAVRAELRARRGA